MHQRAFRSVEIAERVVRRSRSVRREIGISGNLRWRLLDAARALLDEGGRDRLRIRDIADRASVSAPALYYHFADKAALLRALAAAGFEELKLAYRTGGAENANVQDLCGIHIRFAHEHRALYRLMCELRDDDPAAEIVAAEEAAFGALENAVVQALGAGHRMSDAHDLAEGLWAFGHGVAMRALRQSSCGGAVAWPNADGAMRWLKALMRASVVAAGPNLVERSSRP